SRAGRSKCGVSGARAGASAMNPFAAYRDWLVVVIAEPFGAAAIAGKLLADLGCRVARLEAVPEKEEAHDAEEAEVFELLSRSKDSIGVEWSASSMPEVLAALLDRAEILIVDRKGLDRAR